MNEIEAAIAAWGDRYLPGSEEQKKYVQAVALSRYVIRKVVRIVDESARGHGFDPLVHQALLQIFGAVNEPLTVSQLAERLDVVPAFTSRLIKDLEQRGLVERRRNDLDRRVTRVVATAKAGPVLAQIDERVNMHVQLFQNELSDEQRTAALVVFAFFVGLNHDSRAVTALRAELSRKPAGSKAAANAGPAPAPAKPRTAKRAATTVRQARS